MKKLLFILMLAVLGLSACEKDSITGTGKCRQCALVACTAYYPIGDYRIYKTIGSKLVNGTATFSTVCKELKIWRKEIKDKMGKYTKVNCSCYKEMED